MPIDNSGCHQGLASLSPFARETPLTAARVNAINSKFGADSAAIRKILLGVLAQDFERLSIAAETDLEGLLDLLRMGVNYCDQISDLLSLAQAACARLAFAAGEQIGEGGALNDWNALQLKIAAWNSEFMK